MRDITLWLPYALLPDLRLPSHPWQESGKERGKLPHVTVYSGRGVCFLADFRTQPYQIRNGAVISFLSEIDYTTINSMQINL